MLNTVTGSGAWALDPVVVANAGTLTNSDGGGRGGYTYAADNENALSLAPGSASWDGNLRRERGGLGGRSLTPNIATQLFFGGGGGAGDGSGAGAGATGGSGDCGAGWGTDTTGGRVRDAHAPIIAAKQTITASPATLRLFNFTSCTHDSRRLRDTNPLDQFHESAGGADRVQPRIDERPET